MADPVRLAFFASDRAEAQSARESLTARYGAVPAALIGRLARDLRVRGQGVGDLLLADAVRRVLQANRTLAVFAIVVEAKDEAAARFYAAFGFRPFPAHPQRLFMLTSTAEAANGKA